MMNPGFSPSCRKKSWLACPWIKATVICSRISDCAPAAILASGCPFSRAVSVCTNRTTVARCSADQGAHSSAVRMAAFRGLSSLKEAALASARARIGCRGSASLSQLQRFFRAFQGPQTSGSQQNLAVTCAAPTAPRSFTVCVLALLCGYFAGSSPQ